MRTFLAIATLLAGVYAAHAFGLGEGNRFGRLGAFTHKGSGGGGGGVACGNGTINLSTGCTQPMLGGL